MFSREKILKGLKWIGITFGAIMVLGTLWRIPYVLEKQKTQEIVAQIHATKLTLDDVMGKNLPPDPGVDADKTLAGIDANANGIRDDVELAIFKEYPDSQKIRAMLLQHALVLQLEVLQPFLNADIASGVANQQDRSFFCAGEMNPKGLSQDSAVFDAMMTYLSFVEERQFNIEERREAHRYLYSLIKSGRIESVVNCDIDVDLLVN